MQKNVYEHVFGHWTGYCVLISVSYLCVIVCCPYLTLIHECNNHCSQNRLAQKNINKYLYSAATLIKEGIIIQKKRKANIMQERHCTVTQNKFIFGGTCLHPHPKNTQ